MRTICPAWYNHGRPLWLHHSTSSPLCFVFTLALIWYWTEFFQGTFHFLRYTTDLTNKNTINIYMFMLKLWHYDLLFRLLLSIYSFNFLFWTQFYSLPLSNPCSNKLECIRVLKFVREAQTLTAFVLGNPSKHDLCDSTHCRKEGKDPLSVYDSIKGLGERPDFHIKW